MKSLSVCFALVLICVLSACDDDSSGKQDVAANDQTGDSLQADARADASESDLTDRPDSNAGDQSGVDLDDMPDMGLDSFDDNREEDSADDDSDGEDTGESDVSEECPPNLWELEGTQCASEGLSCGGENCVNICSFCNIMMCSGGTWVHLEAYPMDCYDAEIDACIYIEGSYNGCISDITTCDDVVKIYQHITKVSGSSCSSDSDCKVVAGYCGVGLGGCYEVVNVSLNEDELKALGQVYSTLGCTGPVCDCAPPPEPAVCEDHVCRAASL